MKIAVLVSVFAIYLWARLSLSRRVCVSARKIQYIGILAEQTIESCEKKNESNHWMLKLLNQIKFRRKTNEKNTW